MILYTGGPMTDLPEDNIPAFEYVKGRLEGAGHIVRLPPGAFAGQDERNARLTKEEVYRLVLPYDIQGLAECEGVALLPGWQASKGTGLELHFADLVGIPAFIGDDDEGTLEEWCDTLIANIEAYEPIPGYNDALARAVRISADMDLEAR